MSDGPRAQPEAAPGGATRALAGGARCIAVEVRGALYGLPVEDVQEVMSPRVLTRVFHAPAALSGVTSLRGEVLPVLDLALLLGVDGAGAPLEPCIIVAREGSGQRRRAGLLADALAGLRDLPAAGLLPAPASLGELARGAIVGVIGESPPCAVLSVSRLLDSPLLLALGRAG
jgi:purine-binding chemotaxis protein CheW